MSNLRLVSAGLLVVLPISLAHAQDDGLSQGQKSDIIAHATCLRDKVVQLDDNMSDAYTIADGAIAACEELQRPVLLLTSRSFLREQALKLVLAYRRSRR